MTIAVLVLVLAQAAASPSPPPPPTPVPAIAIAPEFTLYHFAASGAAAYTDVANGLLNVTVDAGNLHANATAGDYAFPTVGFPLAPETAAGADVWLYGALPVAAVTYNLNAHLSVAAGKFGALLGQESPFTYQNLDIQRGIGWAMEPTISRGVQVRYANGPWSATLQENDAYYSGSGRALEGLLGWAPSPASNLQFAWIVPGANVPPNPTTSVGNKAEYDLMYARTIGKLQLLPYLLWVHSPASSALGYTSAENASAAVLIASWAFDPRLSIAARYEEARNSSSPSDASLNADLVGFGPGSSAASFTLTPSLRFGNGGILRFEYSHASGTGLSQNRYGLEFGVTH